LVSEKLIITAAHCVYNLDGNLVKLEDVKAYLNVVSVSEIGENSKSSPIEKILPGIFFEKRNGYDIATLVLKNPVKFSRDIAPICLPNFDGEPYKGEKLTVVGWGEASMEFFGHKMPFKAFFNPNRAREAKLDHVPGKKNLSLIHIHKKLFVQMMSVKDISYNSLKSRNISHITIGKKENYVLSVMKAKPMHAKEILVVL